MTIPERGRVRAEVVVLSSASLVLAAPFGRRVASFLAVLASSAPRHGPRPSPRRTTLSP